MTTEALDIFDVPYVFTQDRLLKTDDFCRLVKDWGVDIDRATLDKMVRVHTLVPAFTIATTPDPKMKRVIPWAEYLDFGYWYGTGVLRDGIAAWDDELSDAWLFSKWQAFDVQRASSVLFFLQRGHGRPADYEATALQRRRIALTISALVPRHLPSVVGQISLPSAISDSDFGQQRFETTELPRLEAAHSEPSELRGWGENLLMFAKDDPAYSWWPVMRHSDHSGWDKLRGETAMSVWKRIAAEVILRAHEHLAEDGIVDPLPDVSGAAFWSPHHDRVTPRYENALTLENALSSLGVSPRPRVSLIVEGATEELHILRLLEELGVARPSQVRVIKANSSWISPTFFTRWVSAPRIAGFRGDRAVVDGPPTCTFIALDPENSFATAQKRDEVLNTCKAEIRKDVEAQGALIADDELAQLVDVRAWPTKGHELANFTDDELVSAITTLAQERKRSIDDAWTAQLKADLQWARESHLDIKHVLGKAGLGNSKMELAALLLPVIVAKLENEFTTQITTPMIQLVSDVRDRAIQLSGSGYTLEKI